MSLEGALSRLAIRPTTVCRECRRSIVSSARRQQQQPQSALAALLASSVRSPSAPSAASSGPPPSRPRAAAPSGRTSFAASILNEMTVAKRKQEENTVPQEPRNWERVDLERQMFRKWKAGDVYAPHDLTGAEAAKWKKLRRGRSQKFDVVDQLGINPVHHYKNFSMMSEFMSDMGRIKHRDETGLRPVNQRRMAKAIRRAIGVGLMPGVYRHPEILKLEMKNKRILS